MMHPLSAPLRLLGSLLVLTSLPLASPAAPRGAFAQTAPDRPAVRGAGLPPGEGMPLGEVAFGALEGGGMIPSAEAADEPAGSGSTDDPDGLDSRIRYWRGVRRNGRTPRSGDEVSYQVGDLIKLRVPPGVKTPVAWDIPEELATEEEYHFDEAKRVLILPSSRPGRYRVSLWTCEGNGGLAIPLLPGPAPPVLVLQQNQKPKKVKTFLVVVEGAAPTDRQTKKEDTETLPRPIPATDLGNAYRDDKNAGEGDRKQLRSLASQIRKLVDDLDGLRTVGQVYAPLREQPRTNLPRTRRAIIDRLTKVLRLRENLVMTSRQKDAFKRALKEVADALDRLE